MFSLPRHWPPSVRVDYITKAGAVGARSDSRSTQEEVNNRGCFCSSGLLWAVTVIWCKVKGKQIETTAGTMYAYVCMFVCAATDCTSPRLLPLKMNSALFFCYDSYWNNQIYWPTDTHTHTKTQRGDLSSTWCILVQVSTGLLCDIIWSSTGSTTGTYVHI